MSLATRIAEEFNTVRGDIESEKQDTLVSGTNIKTINGESALGSGDIAIQSGVASWSMSGTNVLLKGLELSGSLNSRNTVLIGNAYYDFASQTSTAYATLTLDGVTKSAPVIRYYSNCNCNCDCG